jgi:DNA-binding transcriptional regulator YiaG
VQKLSETITYFSKFFEAKNLEPQQENKMTNEEQIRLLAYHLWEENGRPEGNDLNFWLQAERLFAARARLKEVRVKGIISQSELAKKLGVSAKTVRSWERGERSPSQEHICELEKISS